MRDLRDPEKIEKLFEKMRNLRELEKLFLKEFEKP